MPKKVKDPEQSRRVNTPIKANKIKTLAGKEDDTLMEFEQFISRKPNNSRTKVWLAFTLVVIIVLLGVAWLFISQVKTLEKDYKFQAISLDNGQVYYAKIVKEDALNIYLDEVYYIQIEQQSISAEEEGAEPQVVEVPVLIKRGQELHRPQGPMQINRSKVVAVEEIGVDSQILTEIDRINK